MGKEQREHENKEQDIDVGEQQVDGDVAESEGDSQNEMDIAEQKEHVRTNNQTAEEKRQAKIDQKALSKTRKLNRPQGELVDTTKKTWERLRQKSLSNEEKVKCMSDIMQSISGKISDLVFKHDASRMIQCCLKFGNAAQRDTIAEELKKHYVELSKSQYGKFIVSKILNFCSPKYRQMIITSFHGNVTKLLRHKHACVVLEEAYSQFCNSAQRASLIEEFYGPEFALFKDKNSQRSLADILKKAPEKKPSIIKNLFDIISSILSKETVTMGPITLFHRILLDFLNLEPEASQIQSIIELLKDHLVSMLHTREGAKFAQICITHASPKDRKHILKTFKTFIHKIAIEQYGHTVLLTCFECVDDTVLVGKCIIQELVSSPKPGDPAFSEGISCFSDLLRHKYASKVVMFLLTKRDKKSLPNFIIQELAELDAVRVLKCKKDSEIREAELLTIISPFLIKCCTENAKIMLKDKFASQILMETVNICNGEKDELKAAIAKCLSGVEEAVEMPTEFNVVKKMKLDKDAQKISQSTEHLLIDRISNKVIRQLIIAHSDFALLAWNAISGDFEYWIMYCVREEKSSGTAFCLLSLVESASVQELFMAKVGKLVTKFGNATLKEKSGVSILVEKIKSLL